MNTFIPYITLEVRYARGYFRRHALDTTVRVAAFLWTQIGKRDREHFVVLCLDQAHHVTGFSLVSVGDLIHVPVHPREVFKPAILTNAVCIILGHNHPSGRLSPSADDRALTEDLVRLGTLHRIPVRDHVIVGPRRGYFSFAEGGLL